MSTATATAQGQQDKPAVPSDRALVAVISDKQQPMGLRISNVQTFLEKNKASIFQALPKHLTPDRMMRVVLSNLRKTPKLLDCTPESLFSSITNAASLGLETDGILGQAYLIPYGKECTLVPGYKGLLALVRRSRQLSVVDVQSVRKGDSFQYQLGDNPYIRHTPNEDDPERDSKPITHVYAVARMRDGGIQRQIWSHARIESHRRKFSSSNPTWKEHWEAMAQKTVLRALCKLLPMSPEAMDMLAREEAIDVQFARQDAPRGLSLDELDRTLSGLPAPEDEPLDEGPGIEGDDEPNPEVQPPGDLLGSTVDPAAYPKARQAIAAAKNPAQVSKAMFEAKGKVSEQEWLNLENEKDERLEQLKNTKE